MKLKDHDLKQMNKDYLKSLPPDRLVEVSWRLLEDLKETRDRLNQTSQNSSRPSSSFAPWETGVISKNPPTEETPPPEEKETPKPEKSEKETTVPRQKKQVKKNRGKQKGAKGHGRKITLPITAEKEERAQECAACGAALGEADAFVARTGLYVLDVQMGNPGLTVSHVKHVYGDTTCSCGHVTQSKPKRCPDEANWEVAMSEWHLVGPLLASLIICLSLRMRLSRPRIQEFLHDWLGIYLSVGVINQTITEGGRASEPIEAELIAEVQQSELLHVDETGWKEDGKLLWLWVLVTDQSTLFLMGRRSWDVIAAALDGFAGWLMSDGYHSYRQYAKRLRCLAHLLRKARGLSESLNEEAQRFGEKTLSYMAEFIKGIYRAREGPGIILKEEFAEQLAELKAWCETHRDSTHEKTRQLAREFLNDWDAIWTVLEHPELPITNNIAECALRHWVIARKISHGTRTKQGSRSLTLLASVIETCRQRQVSPWPYLAEVIAQRRQGNSVPPLPAPTV